MELKTTKETHPAQTKLDHQIERSENFSTK